MNKYDLYVIGAGGTGTYFLKEAARYLDALGNSSPIMTAAIVDGDKVEDKNLSRQSFMEEDIGHYKSAVMADALYSAFPCGAKWTAVGEYLTDLSLLNSGRHIPLVIGCVDNHGCRLLLEKFFAKSKDIIYFDSANEFTTGEVVFAYKQGGKVVSPCRSHYFPEILKGDTRQRTEMSCSELNTVAPQHITANMMAGQILLTEFCSLMEGKPHPGMVTFDTAEFYSEYHKA
jgi:molybdopterin/thiamine biosynthesis adenylyltransferase